MVTLGLHQEQRLLHSLTLTHTHTLKENPEFVTFALLKGYQTSYTFAFYSMQHVWPGFFKKRTYAYKTKSCIQLDYGFNGAAPVAEGEDYSAIQGNTMLPYWWWELLQQKKQLKHVWFLVAFTIYAQFFLKCTSLL